MRRSRPIRITAATAVAVAVAAIGAQAAPAAEDFERGDVLASIATPSEIARFAPDGTVKGTLADSAGAGPLCFDPSGEHLIAPGAGLYDNTGALLKSEWASVQIPVNGSCTVAESGNVFVGGGPTSGGPIDGRGTIRRFDLTGHLLHSYDVDATGQAFNHAVTSVDLAPDGCTIYYELDGGDQIKRYDVCTDLQEAPFGSAGFVCDGLRVRPDGQVAVTCDAYGALLDASGVEVRRFDNPSTFNATLRYAALDPDGSSFWMGAYGGMLARYDIATGGKSLVSWRAGAGLHGVAVYSPPPPPPPPPPDTETTNTESTNTETSLDPGAVQSGANAVDAAAPRRKPAVTAPAFAVARSRLITSGRSLVLDTGLRATCRARGPRCHATVALTVAAPGPRAVAATRSTRIGTLSTTIAPGATAKLAVRLSRSGSALVRKRRTVMVAVRATIRAGSGPAVVRKTNVRVRLSRLRDSR